MKLFKKRPSPAMIVAILALVVSLAGTAGAGPIAEISLNRGEKKQVRKISRNISGKVSNRRITKRAPGLNVASARHAVIANVANASNSAITATNAKNAENADSADNADNAEALGGVDPDDYRRYEGTIPSGATVTGFWGLHERDLPENEVAFSSVSLPLPAPDDLQSGDINFAPSATAGDDDASCTGTYNAPTAPVGTVCLYISGTNDDADDLQGFQASGTTVARGFTISGTGTEPVSDIEVRGSWAYTAG